MDMKTVIARLTEEAPLTYEEVHAAMSLIMAGEATEAQIGAFIMGIRNQGVHADMVAAGADVMRACATPIACNDGSAVDIVGTGGDGSHTFNISTTAAFVIAGAGVTVAKHGSYGVSSRCGSANVLDALGINLQYTPARMEEALETIGIAFLFAPALHPAMKHAVGPRREMGIWSLFNLLGPLCNPASTRRGLTGVFSAALLPIIADAQCRLGVDHQLIVHGDDGLDEITTTSTTQIIEIRGEDQERYLFSPEELGVPLALPESLVGGDAAENAAISRAILSGEEQGAKRDAVLVNSAFALYTSGKAASPAQGMELAASSIDSGAALDKLTQLAAHSHQ